VAVVGLDLEQCSTKAVTGAASEIRTTEHISHFEESPTPTPSNLNL
jgi:hypothetical protein